MPYSQEFIDDVALAFKRCNELETELKTKNERIKGLEQKNGLLRIDLAEALEYCIGDDIEAATKSLEQALK